MLTRQEIEDVLARWNNVDEIGDDEADSPWDSNSNFDAEGIKNEVKIVLSNRIYIDSTGMSNKFKRQIRRMATFSNKQYYQNQAMDLPNYDESRYIYLGDDEGKYLILQMGLKEELLRKFDKVGIRYSID